MSSDDRDFEAQLEPPQQTIRAEAPDPSTRNGQQYTYGEARVLLHSVTAITRMQVDAAPTITDLITRLKEAETAAQGWLRTQLLSETGIWRANKEAFARHHRAGTNGEGADDTVLARRARIKLWMYWSLLAVLVAADFMFFLKLWRDVEEATDWFSVQTLQAAIYGLITPVVLQTVAFGLGRVAATWLRKGRDIQRSDRSLLTLLGIAGTVAVLTIVFGVMQRITMQASVEEATPVNPVLFYCLFLILPLGLGIAEVLRHDEVVALDELRSAANVTADDHVSTTTKAGTAVFTSWVGAYDKVVQFRDVFYLGLQEPFYAAADLIAQERAHHGNDGAYADLLWPDPANARSDGGANVELSSGTFDPVINGPTPRVNLDRLKRLDDALEAHRPPSPSDWLDRVTAVLTAAAAGQTGHAPSDVDDVPAGDRPADGDADSADVGEVTDSRWDHEVINGFDVPVDKR